MPEVGENRKVMYTLCDLPAAYRPPYGFRGPLDGPAISNPGRLQDTLF